MSKNYILKLYIIGSSPASEIALRRIEELISRESKIIFQLEVIDVIKNPQLAENDKILAVPTLVKKLPKPVRKIIGDLSDIEKILVGLNIISQTKKAS